MPSSPGAAAQPPTTAHAAARPESEPQPGRSLTAAAALLPPAAASLHALGCATAAASNGLRRSGEPLVCCVASVRSGPVAPARFAPRLLSGGLRDGGGAAGAAAAARTTQWRAACA